MMSSEEDTDCFGLYGDKLLKKAKRTRQRVDAGEPRNSYSSIPNFSSRPSFMSGGLYGAIFSQNQNHFGLFGPGGYGSAKMLNELLGRQVKQAQDASGQENVILSSSMDQSSTNSDNNNKHSFESVTQNSAVLRRSGSGGGIVGNSGSSGNSGIELDGGSTPPQSNDLAHHMLRTILQGKKDMIGNLEQEIRQTNHNNIIVGARSSPDNNNSLSKNNNNNNNNNLNNNNNNINSNNNNNNNNLNNNNNTNNNLNNNNNNNILNDVKNELISLVGGEISDSSDIGVNSASSNKVNQNKNFIENENSRQLLLTTTTTTTTTSIDSNNSNGNDLLLQNGLNHDNRDNLLINKKEQDELLSLDDDMIELNSRPESVDSIQSVQSDDCTINLLRPKEEIDNEMINSEKDCLTTVSGLQNNNNNNNINNNNNNINNNNNNNNNNKNEPVALDMKRARVENIVSTMRSSPILLPTQQTQVNGCKKRKLYHPQQHDNSAVERYAVAAAGLNLGLNIQNLMLDDDEEDEDDDDIDSPQIHQKRVEKDALKSQLRSMQEQLAEMQQKYVQLCSRMEQESETQEDPGSDLDQDDNIENVSDKQPIHRTPTPPIKELPPKIPTNNNPPTNMLTQVMNKMMSGKMHNQMGHHPHMPPNFNGAHPFLQHMQQHVPNVHNEHQMQQHSHVQHPHHAISNAAAMYLGVSQKLLMEQEARMVKEVAEQHERHERQERHHHQQQQQQQQQQQHQQQQQQQQAQQAQQQQQQHLQQQQQLLQQHQQQLQQNSNQNSQQNHHSPVQNSHHQQQQQQHQPQIPKGSTIPTDLTERLNIMRNATNLGPMSGADLEGLADILKSEITASLSNLVDSIVTRFVHQRRYIGKQTEAAAAAAAEQLNKDLMMASQLLERKTPPRIKISERTSNNSSNTSSNNNNNNNSNNSSNNNNNSANNNNKNTSNNNNNTSNNSSTSSNNNNNNNSSSNNQSGNNGSISCNNNNQPNHILNHSSNSLPVPINNQNQSPRINGNAFPQIGGMSMHVNGPQHDNNNLNINHMNMQPHVRPSPSAAMFQAPKPPQSLNTVAAAALYNSINALGGHTNSVNPFCIPEPREQQNNEQNEALSLVVTPKKKRHKVTDTRITPRTVSRILAQDGIGPSSNHHMDQNNSNNNNKSFGNIASAPSSTPTASTPSPRPTYHPQPPPPSMMPVSLPTSVAIPNPSLHESQVFSPYSPFFNPHGHHGGPHGPQPSQLHHMQMSSSPPGLGSMMDPRESPPLPHPPTMLHPALLAAAHHGSSPDYGHIRAQMDSNDRNSDCNSGDIPYDGMQPTMSFSNARMMNINDSYSLSAVNSSTLTPMHLRKAKLMFFWVRYPSSAVLKMYFPDIKFNKNNTAQLVKWFSNFREFYYIQMEKYARQAVSEGVKSADDLHVGGDSEIYRVLNLHYNRNNHIEVPGSFRFVVEQTLREFFKAIQGGKDTEQSWKKSIYKIISRLDDPVPDYFKTPNFLEQLE